MSRVRDNYENSRARKLKRWYDGDVDLLQEITEIKAPPAEQEQVPEAWRIQQSEAQASQNLMWPQGMSEETVWEGRQKPTEEQIYRNLEASGLWSFEKLYRVMAVILCAAIIAVLLWTVTALPMFGEAGNPANNEVPQRYIESGVQETGAVNFVTGMILDYRAFDTFGESCVLFIASCCVLVLLRVDIAVKGRNGENLGEDDTVVEPRNDVVLQTAAKILVPMILVFGIYIVLNGHLSPGGGFSGGAVLGSGLILYLNAFGFKKTHRFFTEKVYRRMTLCALTFYCLAKSYSFFTGANHLESGIPLGTPGAILSSGLILPLNICVGLVVACTMYAFFTLFRKGGM